jgi:hypothetical protein
MVPTSTHKLSFFSNVNTTYPYSVTILRDKANTDSIMSIHEISDIEGTRAQISGTSHPSSIIQLHITDTT